MFGGYFETDFELWSKKLFEKILSGEHVAIVSDITLGELMQAPQIVQDFSNKIISGNAEMVLTNNEGRQIII